MGRIIRIIFFAVFFILIFLALAGIYEGCNKNKGLAVEKKTMISDSSNRVEEDLNSITEEFFDEDEQKPGTSDTKEQETSDPANSTASLEDELFKAPKQSNQTKSKPTVVQKPRSTTGSGSQGGRYVVIAGNYINRRNAESMVSKLKSLGYANADFFVFDGSKYFTVSAANLKNMSEAKSISNELKQKGIDNYVHTKQN